MHAFTATRHCRPISRSAKKLVKQERKMLRKFKENGQRSMLSLTRTLHPCTRLRIWNQTWTARRCVVLSKDSAARERVVHLDLTSDGSTTLHKSLTSLTPARTHNTQHTGPCKTLIAIVKPKVYHIWQLNASTAITQHTTEKINNVFRRY